MGEGARTTVTVLVTSALVVLGLLNGACGSSDPSGHCWQPGACREVNSASSCDAGESFELHDCSRTLRVGTCVGLDGHEVHLYAPLHGLLLTPRCEHFTGPSSTFQRE
jgi:hypothetical protein